MEQNLDVLIVEDNREDAQLLELALKRVRPDIEINYAQTMSDACSAVRDHNFDVVLLDLRLPDTDGTSGITQIQQANDSVPIVVISGNDDEDVAVRSVKMGAEDYLVKGDYASTTVLRSIRYAIERKHNASELRYLAQHDALTGAANHQRFTDELVKAVGHAERAGTKAGVFYMDVDRLKRINDELGHEAGDELLRQIATRLRDSVRKGDTVARLEGDRLGIIAEALKTEQDAQSVSDRIHAALAKPFQLGESVVAITGSVGVAIFPDDGEEIEQLPIKAEIAMRRAKDNGRNRTVFYNDDVDSRLKSLRHRRSELETAIKLEQFEVVFQPRLYPSEQIHSLESVVRWRHDEKGLLDERHFMPFAEDTGLIVDLDKLIIKTVCREIGAWRMVNEEVPCASVRISSQQFQTNSLPRTVAEVCTLYSIPPSALEISFSESVLLDCAGEAIEAIHQLAELGVKLSIYDFGAGYCALHYLRHLPVDTLNIHHALVADLASSTTAALAQSLITLAHNLGFVVAAGGIDDRRQARTLTKYGCDVLHGPLFSAPLAPGDVPGLIDRTEQQSLESTYARPKTA